MFLLSVIEHIETAGIATFEDDMFGSEYPSTAPDECVLVRDSGGPPPSKELPVEVHLVQFLCRALDYPTAINKAWQIFKLFHGKVSTGKWQPLHNFIIGTTDQYYVFTSSALQMPSDISPDEKGRSEVSFNISFKIRLGS